MDNPGLLGTVIAIYNIGCFVGAVSAMWIGEALGRPKTVLLGTTIMTVGAVLQIAAYGVPQMIVARVVAGIGNGINTATAPVWQSETSQMKWRGKLVVIELILNIAGFSLSNWVTYGLSFASGPVSWRFPIAFQLVFILILFATVPWLPESPRWLIAHGREDAAFQILADLEDRELDDPWILAQHKEIVFAVDYERRNAVGWADLLRGRTGPQGGTCTVRRLLLGAGTQAMQQLAGINVTSYYLPTVLIESVRVDEKLARLLAAVNSVSYLLFSLIAIPNVERWGRRRLMMFGALGQGVCYMLITILIKYSLDDSYSAAQQKQFGSASIAFFFLYYVFFGIGWQGVPWLYPVEVNSLSMRTKGAAIGTSLHPLNPSTIFIPLDPSPLSLCFADPPRRHRQQLDLQLHGRRDHAHRHRHAVLALLHHLDHLQLRLPAHHLLPLPGDGRAHPRGHRPLLPRQPPHPHPPRQEGHQRPAAPGVRRARDQRGAAREQRGCGHDAQDEPRGWHDGLGKAERGRGRDGAHAGGRWAGREGYRAR